MTNRLQQHLQGIYAIANIRSSSDNIDEQVKQALLGGACIIQYRDKLSVDDTRLKLAQRLRSLTSEFNALLIINDDVDLALKVDADGVHLGQQDLIKNNNDSAIRLVRQRLGADKIIGITCHADIELAKIAEQQSADYVAFGRFFASQTKPEASPAPLDILLKAKQTLTIPVCAIGGVTPDNGQQLIDQGADMLAVIHGIFSQDNITAATKCYVQLFAKKQ